MVAFSDSQSNEKIRLYEENVANQDQKKKLLLKEK